MVERVNGGRWVPGQVERVGDLPLKAVLRGLGGWPVVSSQWDQSNWTLEVALGQLRGRYNAPVLVRMMVATDDKNSSVHIMQVTAVWRWRAVSGLMTVSS